MERFFFNVHNGTARYDETGTVLPDIKAVRMRMLVLGLQMLCSEPIPRDGWRMEVLSTTGEIVCSMQFGEEPD